MRPLLMAFLFLSPFIAIAQNYHGLPHLQLARVVHEFAADAGMKMADMVHAVQSLGG